MSRDVEGWPKDVTELDDILDAHHLILCDIAPLNQDEIGGGDSPINRVTDGKDSVTTSKDFTRGITRVR